MVATPKLYVFAIHKLPGALFCFLVIGAPKFVTLQDTPNRARSDDRG
jgi:hypothetical protein